MSSAAERSRSLRKRKCTGVLAADMGKPTDLGTHSFSCCEVSCQCQASPEVMVSDLVAQLAKKVFPVAEDGSCPSTQAMQQMLQLISTDQSVLNVIRERLSDSGPSANLRSKCRSTPSKASSMVRDAEKPILGQTVESSSVQQMDANRDLDDVEYYNFLNTIISHDDDDDPMDPDFEPRFLEDAEPHVPSVSTNELIDLYKDLGICFDENGETIDLFMQSLQRSPDGDGLSHMIAANSSISNASWDDIPLTIMEDEQPACPVPSSPLCPPVFSEETENTDCDEASAGNVPMSPAHCDSSPTVADTPEMAVAVCTNQDVHDESCTDFCTKFEDYDPQLLVADQMRQHIQLLLQLILCARLKPNSDLIVNTALVMLNELESFRLSENGNDTYYAWATLSEANWVANFYNCITPMTQNEPKPSNNFFTLFSFNNVIIHHDLLPEKIVTSALSRYPILEVEKKIMLTAYLDIRHTVREHNIPYVIRQFFLPHRVVNVVRKVLDRMLASANGIDDSVTSHCCVSLDFLKTKSLTTCVHRINTFDINNLPRVIHIPWSRCPLWLQKYNQNVQTGRLDVQCYPDGTNINM